MSRRRGKTPRIVRVPGDTSDPYGMPALLLGYLDWLDVKGYSEWTRIGLEKQIGYFIVWCAERGVARASEVTRAVIERYHRWVHAYRMRSGEPLTLRSQGDRVAAVLGFFRWLARQRHILGNPGAEVELPRVEKRLPREVLTAREVERVAARCDVSTPIGLRDRAMIETLYATGIRRMELARLERRDLDFERGVLLVREGKGRRDRFVPIGERAMAWIAKYVSDARPQLVVQPDEGVLFLTVSGEQLTGKYLSAVMHAYVKQAHVGKKGSCHLFRHSMATLMLENGADIRYIQAILGHAQLSTTAIYTQVSISKLIAVHAATHPASGLHRRTPTEVNTELPPDPDAVLAALEAESIEDE